MRSLGASVPRAEGERVRQWLVARGLVRTDLRIARDAERIVIPVTGRADVPDVETRWIEVDFVETRGARRHGFRDLLDWPEEERARLPRAFDIVGDVVLIRLPPELADRATEIGRALLEFVPGARVVGWDRGVHGTERIRSLVRIAGSGSFLTVHRENGLAIEVDLEKAYFSPRLAREHARVAAELRPRESLLDLCCGVGPFSLLAARQGRASGIVAVDVNPDAIALFEKNRQRIRSAVPTGARCADLAEFLPTADPADRVILNLPLEGIKYLTSVAGVVSPGGTLHFYDVSVRAESAARQESAVAALEAGNPGWETRAVHRVHPYAPTLDLVAYDFHRRDR